MNKKILTITIPCYNSQDYMKKCVDHALLGGELVEILIVDDGSTDDTAKIADAYAEKYPTIVKAIHKENGGHGDAVNTGIAHATGVYFKVVDSDDWLDKEAYKQVLKVLKKLVEDEKDLDACHALSWCFAGETDHKLGRQPDSVQQVSVCIDAFGDLPDTAAEGLRTATSEAYILCG